MTRKYYILTWCHNRQGRKECQGCRRSRVHFRLYNNQRCFRPQSSDPPQAVVFRQKPWRFHTHGTVHPVGRRARRNARTQYTLLCKRRAPSKQQHPHDDFRHSLYHRGIVRRHDTQGRYNNCNRHTQRRSSRHGSRRSAVPQKRRCRPLRDRRVRHPWKHHRLIMAAAEAPYLRRRIFCVWIENLTQDLEPSKRS